MRIDQLWAFIEFDQSSSDGSIETLIGIPLLGSNERLENLKSRADSMAKSFKKTIILRKFVIQEETVFFKDENI